MELITILGQTSSGKSELAVELAMYLISTGQRTCIVGCDSRQIYKGLDIGTGKILGLWLFDPDSPTPVFEYRQIKHFLIDFVDPTVDYNLPKYVADFYKLANSIKDQFDIMILVGGTGLYAKAILEKIDLGNLQTQYTQQYEKHKKELQQTDLVTLQRQITQSKIHLNNSDFNNKVRLVSNLLRVKSLDQGWLERSKYFQFTKQRLFAIAVDQSELKAKIRIRLENRFNQGLVDEVKQFAYLGQAKLMSLGLEYRLGWLFLQGELSQPQLEANLLTQNLQYAKRQLTWLNKQKNLIWVRSLQDLLAQLDH
jgi:tRNA dimethylallyltransferase